jgi:glycosyltransferase involved in cell wall biosynthesis
MSDAERLSCSGHTVVVPLYNKAAWIGETIASLAEQTQPPDQLVIIDDASTDGSMEAAYDALSAHGAALSGCRIDLVALPRNGGPGAARNAGLARAEGERISFHDADDIYRADALHTIGERMRSHRLGMAVLGYDSAPQGERWPEPNMLVGGLVPLEADTFLMTDPLRTVAHPAFVMGRASNVAARRTLLSHTKYHTGVRLNEGIDFWYRVLKAAVREGVRVGLITAPLIRFRILEDSLSHRLPSHWRELEVPPSLLRFAESCDADDQRLNAMLARRWVDHARKTLPNPAQMRDFLNHHHPLLVRCGVADAEVAP